MGKFENVKIPPLFCHRNVVESKIKNLEYGIDSWTVATTISHSFICLNERFIKYWRFWWNSIELLIETILNAG